MYCTGKSLLKRPSESESRFQPQNSNFWGISYTVLIFLEILLLQAPLLQHLHADADEHGVHRGGAQRPAVRRGVEVAYEPLVQPPVARQLRGSGYVTRSVCCIACQCTR